MKKFILIDIMLMGLTATSFNAMILQCNESVYKTGSDNIYDNCVLVSARGNSDRLIVTLRNDYSQTK